MRAFLFPGQGSQAVGMGAALAAASRAAQDVFAEVDEALGQNLFRLMREGPDDDLKLTENAQPAIMAHSIAVLRAWGVRLPDVANFVAGHSLGEYSALCTAGSFDLPTTAKLLKLRGQAMQAALKPGQRLVSKDGDLWRWDGYSIQAGTASAAGARLVERSRLAALKDKKAEAEAEQASAEAALAEAVKAAEAAAQATKSLRVEAKQVHAELDRAREAIASSESGGGH